MELYYETRFLVRAGLPRPGANRVIVDIATIGKAFKFEINSELPDGKFSAVLKIDSKSGRYSKVLTCDLNPKK